MNGLFDSHNHLQSPRFGKPVDEMIAEMRAVGISGCVTNATREDDWDAVAELAAAYPDFVYPAYGIHPWFAHTVKDGWEDRLRERLADDPNATVGEIGVDGWVEGPGLEVQGVVFMKQAEIAAEFERVATIHCLKAWEQLFEAMSSARAWPERFLMHSFGGSIEIAERLLKEGAWFSFSGYFLHPRKAKVVEMFRRLPPDRILIETDAPDMLPPEELLLGDGDKTVNSPVNLVSCNRELERRLGKKIPGSLGLGAREFFGIKSA